MVRHNPGSNRLDLGDNPDLDLDPGTVVSLNSNLNHAEIGKRLNYWYRAKFDFSNINAVSVHGVED